DRPAGCLDAPLDAKGACLLLERRPDGLDARPVAELCVDEVSRIDVEHGVRGVGILDSQTRDLVVRAIHLQQVRKGHLFQVTLENHRKLLCSPAPGAPDTPRRAGTRGTVSGSTRRL